MLLQNILITTLYDVYITEVVRAMDFLVSEGLIMYWGTAKWSPIDVTEMYTACRQLNCSTPILEQSEYHMLCREKVEIYMPELYNKIGEWSGSDSSSYFRAHVTQNVKMRYRVNYLLYVLFSSTNHIYRISFYVSGVGLMAWSPLAMGLLPSFKDSLRSRSSNRVSIILCSDMFDRWHAAPFLCVGQNIFSYTTHPQQKVYVFL